MRDAVTIRRPAAFREALTVENESKVALGGGAYETTWTAQGTVRARVRVLKGREHLQARQIGGVGNYEVTLRYPYPSGVSVTSQTRFVWAGPAGDQVLSCTEPPRIDPQGRYATVLCASPE